MQKDILKRYTKRADEAIVSETLEFLIIKI